MRPVYFISDRPEAYEVWGEIGQEEAGKLAALIADHAGRHFPSIEFRIDGEWHTHDQSMDKVAAYIESHWQAWWADTKKHRETA